MSTKDYVMRLGVKATKLSYHFSVAEFVHSDTAEWLGIDNSIDSEEFDNAKDLCCYVLERLRSIVNKPVIINSGYRCSQLNKSVGGAVTSQHLLGQAADIKVEGYSIDELFDICCDLPLFDQVINEGSWIHISYNALRNRKQKLIKKGCKYVQVK